MTKQIRMTEANQEGWGGFLGLGNSFGIRQSSFVIWLLLTIPISALGAASTDIVVHPTPYSGPLRNPMMGFIGPPNGKQEYATLAREYVKWNTIENSSADGVEKLRAYANAHWKGIEQRNIKVIPRVFLEWPKGSGMTEYWPIDSYWP